MKCASCHDSFIDTWKLTTAYAPGRHHRADRQLEIYRCDKPTGRHASPRFVFPRAGTIDAAPAEAKRLEQFAGCDAPDNGRFTRTIANRIWQRLMGRGIVHPVDVMANRPWNEDLLDYLGVYLAIRSTTSRS